MPGGGEEGGRPSTAASPARTGRRRDGQRDALGCRPGLALLALRVTVTSNSADDPAMRARPGTSLEAWRLGCGCRLPNRRWVQQPCKLSLSPI